jgi:hypothetical protein
MVEHMAGRRRQEDEAIAHMKTRYGQAEALARTSNDPGLFYPALNRMAAELIVDAGKPQWGGFDAAAAAEVRQALATKTRDDPDFWSVVGLTELRLYEGLAKRNLAGERAGIETEYQVLHSRVGAPLLWGSALDQVEFVLSKYADRASAAEKKAATALLDFLAKLADGRPACGAH